MTDAPTQSVSLTVLVAAPAIGAALVAAAPQRFAKRLALGVMALVAAVALSLLAAPASPGLTVVQTVPWAPSLGLNWSLGVDGLSLPLVLLTVALTPMALAASWKIDRRPRLYCASLLLLQTGMLGVFLALDFVLFYVFWELTLVPMWVLIALWGGPNRKAAAWKFVAFTLVGGVLMLAGGLLLYGYSDVTPLSAEDMIAAGAAATPTPAKSAVIGPRTFNLLALATVGRETDAFDQPLLAGKSVAWWAFVLLLLGMAIKLPAAPLHTWLPAAHVEAPTGVSMLLAGVMLKMGGYGMVRLAWPACPGPAAELAPAVATVGVVSLFWGALAAMAQNDFKRLVAYSSVSHMGYVMLGLAVGATAAGGWNADAWTLGATGAVFQMVAHGVTSAGLFFAVGVLAARVGHRDLDRLGGVMNRMPVAAGLSIVLAMASLGLPTLCGFVGELLVLLPTWSFSQPLAIAAAAATVLTAAYTLRAVRLAYYGAEPRGPNAERLTPLSLRETWILAPLAAAAIVLGVRPAIVIDRIEPVLAAQGERLAAASARRLTERTPPLAPDRGVADVAVAAGTTR